LLVERLKDRNDVDAMVAAIGEPSQLLDYVDGCDRLIVVDACESGASAGEVTRLAWPDPRIAARRAYSTHGFGVAQMLGLVEQLGRLPREVILFGIEMKHCRCELPLSSAVQHGLDELEQELVREIRVMARESYDE
jgi:hydrogenase maturation protease